MLIALPSPYPRIVRFCTHLDFGFQRSHCLWIMRPQCCPGKCLPKLKNSTLPWNGITWPSSQTGQHPCLIQVSNLCRIKDNIFTWVKPAIKGQLKFGRHHIHLWTLANNDIHWQSMVSIEKQLHPNHIKAWWGRFSFSSNDNDERLPPRW